MTALKILIVICSIFAALAEPGPTTGGGVADTDRDTVERPEPGTGPDPDGLPSHGDR